MPPRCEGIVAQTPRLAQAAAYKLGRPVSGCDDCTTGEIVLHVRSLHKARRFTRMII